MNVETSHSIYLASRGNRPQAATAHSPHSTHTHMERRSLSVDWPFQGWHKPHVFLHFLNAARRLRHLPFLRNFLHFFRFFVSVQFAAAFLPNTADGHLDMVALLLLRCLCTLCALPHVSFSSTGPRPLLWPHCAAHRIHTAQKVEEVTAALGRARAADVSRTVTVTVR